MDDTGIKLMLSHVDKIRYRYCGSTLSQFKKWGLKKPQKINKIIKYLWTKEKIFWPRKIVK